MGETEILQKLLAELQKDYGPYIPMIAYLLYVNLKQPVKNFIENIQFKDIISFKKHRVQAKKLSATMVSLQNAINKEREIGEFIDKLRDKYNFKYSYVSIYSNGETDLLGMGKYKYSIEYEKPRHDSIPIRQLYQNQSLIPFFPLISTLTKNEQGEVISFEYKTSLIEINLVNADQNHPLKHKYYMHGIETMYILLLLEEVTVKEKNQFIIKHIPIGDLICAADAKTSKITKDMISDLYLSHKSILQVLEKYADKQSIK